MIFALFRNFFEANFEARFGLAQNHEKWRNKTEVTKFWVRAPVGGWLLGREKERGYKI